MVIPAGSASRCVKGCHVIPAVMYRTECNHRLDPVFNIILQVMVNASADGRPAGSANGFVGEKFSLAVPEAHLWSFDDPFLYDLDVVLLGGQNADGETVRHLPLHCCRVQYLVGYATR